ncbi:PrgI family protein [Candidatus Saccharibacteria bacterium]|nr:PrgI family protein [Candidatus Saccharibacteria bacterium]
MSQYTIPQDVETEDKIIGPFGMRQLIYLAITAAMIGLGVALFSLSPVLVVIPLPVAIFFLIIALPLKKDQPMENWVAAIIRFRLKPQKRTWQNDGQESFITIDEAVEIDEVAIKDVAGEEAEKRISFLSQLVDSEGWATRGINSPIGAPTSAISNDVMMESNNVVDMFDSTHSATVGSELAQSQNDYRDALVNQMQSNFETETSGRPADNSAFNIPGAPMNDQGVGSAAQ